MRTINNSASWTLVAFFMFFIFTGSAFAETVWEAGTSCNSDFGFYSNCETFTGKFHSTEMKLLDSNFLRRGVYFSPSVVLATLEGLLLSP